MMIIPVYLIIIRLRLYDTLLALILPSIAFAIPLSVLVLSNFIRDVPKDLFESMRTDGASEWGMLWHLALPLSRPAVAPRLSSSPWLATAIVRTASSNAARFAADGRVMPLIFRTYCNAAAST